MDDSNLAGGYNLSAFNQLFDNSSSDQGILPIEYDGAWEPYTANNNGLASVTDLFSPPGSNSPYYNNHRTSQHRRRHRLSPSNPANSRSTPLNNQLHRTNHESTTDTLPELHHPQYPENPPFEVNQNLQSPSNSQSRFDPYIQLPDINTAFPELNFPDRPSSHWSWGSAGDDSLFGDSDFWRDFQPSNSNHVPDSNGFVDLTTDSSPPQHAMPAARKRRASATARAAPSSSPSRSSKRRKPDEAEVKREDVKVEHLDLLDIDDDSRLSHVLQRQQAAVVKEQQGKQGEEPAKFSALQCIICMEPMTDITVTHCGHLFCHTCIMEALIAGEQQGEPGKAMSKCPVCRKKVSRPKGKGKDKREVIPLEIKLSTRSSIARGKARA
ncbi:MAG: hypothetical protein Q9207_000543 [Kuettlingeria erythrocarpa]